MTLNDKKIEIKNKDINTSKIYDFRIKLLNILLFLIPLIIGLIIKLFFFNWRILTYSNPFMGEPYSTDLIGFDNVEYYDDFNFYTLNFVNYFLAGKLPYTHFFYVGSTPNDFMTYTPYLIYPPLYLYIISMLYNLFYI
ncbi:MAG: hypothetical protein ACTSPQ_17185 [Candidatus Helarchaeota archaeon]